MMPVYLNLSKKELDEKIKQAVALLSPCYLCPRSCGVNRLEGERGFCKNGRYALVASYNLHFGEESPLVGTGGSGTIFFAGCNLGCVFCQNYDISHSIEGSVEVSAEQLAHIMIHLQKKGAHNINFVSPSHVVAQILEALKIAIDLGLKIPLIYNTGAYDKIEVLKILDGIIDIYMPDTKFFNPEPSKKYLKAKDYPEIAKKAIKEMHRQVGDLIINEEGIAVRGLLVRHLLMPNNLAGTEKWLKFIAREISKNTYLNIMDQYRPCGDAHEFPELLSTITYEELEAARNFAQNLGLTRLDEKDLSRLIYFLR